MKTKTLQFTQKLHKSLKNNQSLVIHINVFQTCETCQIWQVFIDCSVTKKFSLTLLTYRC